MSTHVEYLNAQYIAVEYTDERNLSEVVEYVTAQDVLVFGADELVVMTGSKDRLLFVLRRAIEMIEAGATPFERPKCTECGRDFDTLEDLETHEFELDHETETVAAERSED